MLGTFAICLRKSGADYCVSDIAPESLKGTSVPQETAKTARALKPNKEEKENQERTDDRPNGTFCFCCHKVPSPFVPLLCVCVCVCGAVASTPVVVFVHATDVQSRVLR